MKLLSVFVLLFGVSSLNAAESKKDKKVESREPAALASKGSFSDGTRIELLDLSKNFSVIQITQPDGKKCYAIRNSEGGIDAGVAAAISCDKNQ